MGVHGYMRDGGRLPPPCLGRRGPPRAASRHVVHAARVARQAKGGASLPPLPRYGGCLALLGLPGKALALVGRQNHAAGARLVHVAPMALPRRSSLALQNRQWLFLPPGRLLGRETRLRSGWARRRHTLRRAPSSPAPEAFPLPFPSLCAGLAPWRLAAAEAALSYGPAAPHGTACRTEIDDVAERAPKVPVFRSVCPHRSLAIFLGRFLRGARR